jgi:hypothetical protein
MAKKYFMIITISPESYDYDILLNHLYNDSCITKLCIIPQGLFIEASFEDYMNRRDLIGKIVRLDVEDVTIHEILYEEFFSRK